MEETWRWFGPDDTVTLEQIRQAGATGIVTALDHIATGEAWSAEEIALRKRLIVDAGLEWSVVESVPLHNDVKTRSGDFLRHIANYKKSIRELGAAGVHRVCYNFMPVVDWTRTNLAYEMPNKAQALRFEMTDFAAYDLFVLAAGWVPCESYALRQLSLEATERFSNLVAGCCCGARKKHVIAGLPGGEGSYDRDSIRVEIERFSKIDNVPPIGPICLPFSNDVIPVAEEAGVVMAIHPDDPPFSLFGLPRVVSTADDARAAATRQCRARQRADNVRRIIRCPCRQ